MYSYTTRLRYSEYDSNMNLPIVSLVNLFQDCSTYQSEHLQKGMSYLSSKHQAWLVSAWQIELYEQPEIFETVKISTWPYKFDKVLGYRNFTMTNEAGDKVYAVGSSMWTLVNTQTHRATRISPEDIVGYEVSPPFDMEYLPRRIKYPETDYIKLSPIIVVSAHLDTNKHVNNGQYISLADENLPTGFTYNQIRAEYRKPAVLGDTIIPHYYIENNICYMKLMSDTNELYATVEFSTR